MEISKKDILRGVIITYDSMEITHAGSFDIYWSLIDTLTALFEITLVKVESDKGDTKVLIYDPSGKFVGIGKDERDPIIIKALLEGDSWLRKYALSATN